jgi:hypothetical protein
MKTRTILLTLATLFAAFAVCFAAEDVNMGTWKLNVLFSPRSLPSNAELLKVKPKAWPKER